MNVLYEYRDERGESGELTWLARLVRTIAKTGCECPIDARHCLECECGDALVEVVKERDAARAKLAKVRQELAATVECDCGTCLACRVADVVGV